MYISDPATLAANPSSASVRHEQPINCSQSVTLTQLHSWIPRASVIVGQQNVELQHSGDTESSFMYPDIISARSVGNTLNIGTHRRRRRRRTHLGDMGRTHSLDSGARKEATTRALDRVGLHVGARDPISRIVLDGSSRQCLGRLPRHTRRARPNGAASRSAIQRRGQRYDVVTLCLAERARERDTVADSGGANPPQ